MIEAGFAEFQADPDLWVAVLTGRGERAFCAGMDLKDALPTVYARLKDGKEWTPEAEEEFLRVMLPDTEE